jgi:gamma-glutamyltranspeptidase/glutathione hydrolase
MSSRGAVAAGHPLTAEAGAAILREGGNAVDAAVGAVLASFVTESPLTGFGAGGFMLVHGSFGNALLDFFVEVPGRTVGPRRSELVPTPLQFSADSSQVFNVGAASCGVPPRAWPRPSIATAPSRSRISPASPPVSRGTASS